MTFEQHLLSVFRAAFQRLGALSKSWRVFNDWLLLGRCFKDFILPVLEYSYAVWCYRPPIHTLIKLMDRVVSSACFWSGDVFECNIAHRRFVAVFCMMFKFRCIPMHPLDGALHMLVWTCVCLAHRYTYAPPRCRTSQFRRTLCIPLPQSLCVERSCWHWFRWCGTGGL